jgi:hypothetical protein
MSTLALTLWGSATLLTLFLLIQMLWFQQYRTFALFATYLGINLLQTVVGVGIYSGYGFKSQLAFPIVWTTQALVVVARAFSAGEISYLVLGKYKGIWYLAARILSGLGLLALTLALYFGRRSYHIGIITLEIALEASIATWVAGLFLFVRYYELRVERATALLGGGLGLLSCLRIVNDVVFEKFLSANGVTWNYISSATFVGILLLWIWALRDLVPVPVAEPRMQPAQLYTTMIPQLNQRLAALNAQLLRLQGPESPKP